MAKGYGEGGASLTRRALRGFKPNSGSPAEDINENNGTLRERSRLLYMTEPLAAAAVNTVRTKAVGTGLSLKCQVDHETLHLTPEAARAWAKRTEQEFRLWASKRQNCDAIGMNSFNGIQQLVLKSQLLSGDVFALFKRVPATAANPYTLRLQLIEADRVCSPSSYSFVSGATMRIPDGKPGAGHRICDGVEIDDDGMVVAYHICNLYPQQTLLTEERKWTRVLAFGEKTGLPNILHVMDAERPDQYRGVPYLAPVLESLLQLRRYKESELTAAIVQSFLTAWIETEADPSEMPVNEVGMGDTLPEENPSGISNNPNEYEMGPGTVITLKTGEKVQFGNPNIPTAGFENFVNAMCRHLGAALELPSDVLQKKFDASYSASRGALLEAWESMKMMRSWLIEDFCQPVYETWLAEAVAIGRIRAPGFWEDPLIRQAWCGARWIGPVQGQLDPKKEVEAALLRAQYGLSTYTQITREMSGGDWAENMEQLAREREMLASIASAPAEPANDSGGEDDEAT